MENINNIVKGCIDGNRNAQKMLYQTYSKKMFGVCLRYAKDYTEAEDILQDGFIKVFENIKSFRFEGSFEGWLRRILVNTALEKLRKQNILFPVSDVFEYAEESTHEDTLDNITAKDLLKIIQELSPKYRIVFNMYAIEGYTHQDISDKLGISVGTSKSNLSRARQILQERVKKLYPSEPQKLKVVK